VALVVLRLDPVMAGHLALALARYREELARRGYPRPAGLVDLEAMARAAAVADMRGQEGAAADRSRTAAAGDAYGGRHDRIGLLTQKHFAAAVGCDPRTVRRWLDRGEVRSVPVNGRRRIPASELERLTADGGNG
jgi:Helix-turn-helix domain